VEDTIAIRRGLKEVRGEPPGAHTGLRARRAATLSPRYIAGPLLPGKGDRLMYGHVAVRIEIDSVTVEIRRVARRIMKLEIASMALSQRVGRGERPRPSDESEMAELREQRSP